MRNLHKIPVQMSYYSANRNFYLQRSLTVFMIQRKKKTKKKWNTTKNKNPKKLATRQREIQAEIHMQACVCFCA